MISREGNANGFIRKENDLVPLIPLILSKGFKLLLNFGCVFLCLGSLCWREVTDETLILVRLSRDARNHSKSKHTPGMLHCLKTVNLGEGEGRKIS